MCVWGRETEQNELEGSVCARAFLPVFGRVKKAEVERASMGRDDGQVRRVEGNSHLKRTLGQKSVSKVSKDTRPVRERR